MTSATKVIAVDLQEVSDIIFKRAVMSDADREKLAAVLELATCTTRELQKKSASIKRLRQIIFGACTEKSSTVLAKLAQSPAPPTPGGESSTAPPTDESQGASTQPGTEKPKRKGHGRNGASSYTGAQRVPVAHDTLKAQSCCPACQKGKLYQLKHPMILIRVRGQAPLGATAYECEKLRCSSCGEVFVADAPAEAGDQKHDETAAAMIGMLKYGTGFPFHRLARLQAGLGIPLPPGTQWQVVESAADTLQPAYLELARQAAQGEVLYNDDTTAKILAAQASRAKAPAQNNDTDPERTGIFTTGIVAAVGAIRIALFFTGSNHAGENLGELLEHRSQELGPPIQMCDALSRNYSGEFETILANCLSHSRRKFVDVIDSFPEECRYVIETLRDVYHNDSIAKQREMSPAERLAWHQTESGPRMEALREWLKEQIEDKKVEPNSALGEAIEYMTKHWDKLTLFLRVAGAPLDNNICERALKKAILHRKNALFFKTEHGAHVSDVFMSLIHTAEMCRADPFDYLVALLRNGPRVRAAPAQWMPWNYLDALGARDGPDARLPMTA